MANGTLDTSDQRAQTEFDAARDKVLSEQFSSEGQKADVEDAVGVWLRTNNVSPDDLATFQPAIQGFLEGELGADNGPLIANSLDNFASSGAQSSPERQTNSPPTDAGSDRLDPVNLSTGQFCESIEDFVVAGAGIDVRFVRTYKSGVFYAGPLGLNWDHTYNLWLRDDGDSVTVTTGQLIPIRYFPHDDYPYYVALASDDVVVATADDAFEQHSPDGKVLRFEQTAASTGSVYSVARITDRFGNFLQFTYDDLGRLSVVAVNHPERLVTFTYDDQSRIATIELFPVTYAGESGAARIARTWTYTYDDFSDLVGVTGPATDEFPGGRTRRYAYSSPSSFAQRQHDLLRITDPNGTTYIENEYGDAIGTVAYGRVVRQRLGSGVFLIDYADVVADPSWNFDDADRPASSVTVVQRNGHPVRYVLNAMGNILASQETILDDGEREILWRYAYDPDGRKTGVLSAEGRLSQTYYGRAEFYRRQLSADDGSVTLWHEPNLSVTEHARFPNVLATVRRATTVTLEGLLDDVAIYGDVFPDVLVVASDDVVVKWSYEDRFQQVATVSDPRYTASPDPGAAESQDPASPYSRHLIVTSFNGDSGATPAAITYPDTTYPAPLPSGATGITAPHKTFDAYDGNGRLLQWTEPEGNIFAQEYFAADLAAPTRQGFLAASIAGVGVLDLRTTWDVNEAGQVVANTDARGNTTRVELDACSLVRRRSPPLANYEIVLAYEGNAQLASQATAIIDSDGSVAEGSPEVATFLYNQEMSVVRSSVGDSSGTPLRSGERIYDASNRLTSVVRPRGNSICYEYDERSLLRRLIRGCCADEAAATSYAYDGDGLGVAVTSPRGYLTASKLDALGRVIAITDPLGNLQRTDYDKLTNVIARRSFAAETNGAYALLRHTEYEYDERGQLTRERKALFTVSILAADPWGAPDVEFDAAVRNGDVQWCETLTYRDGNLRPFRVVDPNGHAGDTQYDAANRPASMTDAAGNRTSLTYDPAGNVIRRDRHLVDGSGVVRGVLSAVYEFDPLNRLTATIDGAGNSVAIGIDSRNLLRRVTDPLGHVTEHGYNGFRDRVRDTQLLLPRPAGGTATSLTTTRSYDANSNVLDITDPAGNTTAIQYDELDRATLVTNPDGTSRSMTYDPDGNLLDHVDEGGVRVSRSYDAIDRVIALAVQPRTAGPGSGEQSATFSYDGAGALISHDNSILDVQATYDSLGRCYQEVLTFGPPLAAVPPRTIERKFDPASNRVGLIYPSGQTLRYELAPNDNLVRLTSTANAGGYPGDPGAPTNRPILEKQWLGNLAVGAGLGNGATITTAYDAAGRRISDNCSLTSGGDFLLQQLADAAGNRELDIESRPGVTQGRWHAYDSTNRLIESLDLPTAHPVTTSPLAPPITPLPVTSFGCQKAIDAVVASYDLSPSSQPDFDYDSPGNRTNQRTPSGTISYTTNVRNEYVRADSATFRYDLAGRLIENDDFTFAYNFVGQLVRAISKQTRSVVLQIFHDATGRPVGVIEEGHTRVVIADGATPIEFYDDGVLSSLQLWESPTGLCFFAAEGQDHYIVRDILESTRLTLDGRGTAAGVVDFSAFGELLAGTSVIPILYGGKYLYRSIGWYEYRSRQYVPVLGRFAQPDPAGFADGANLYTYVGNNPLSAIDPNGTSQMSANSAPAEQQANDGPQMSADNRDLAEIDRSILRPRTVDEAANGYTYVGNNPVNRSDPTGLQTKYVRVAVGRDPFEEKPFEEKPKEGTGVDLGDFVVWLIKDSTFGKVDHTLAVGFANVFAVVGGATLVEALGPGEMQLFGYKWKLGPRGSEINFWTKTQQIFNDVYREVWELPKPDRELEYDVEQYQHDVEQYQQAQEKELLRTHPDYAPGPSSGAQQQNLGYAY